VEAPLCKKLDELIRYGCGALKAGHHIVGKEGNYGHYLLRRLKNDERSVCLAYWPWRFSRGGKEPPPPRLIPVYVHS